MGAQGVCEARIELIVKMHIKSREGRGRGRGGCEPRIGVIVQMKREKVEGGGSGRGKGLGEGN